MPALKSDSCKKVGLATAIIVTIRDSGAHQEATTNVMESGLALDDPTRSQLPQIVQDVFNFKDLSLHSHRMCRWIECANKSIFKATKSLDELAPELKKCQALTNQQSQVDCMASVVSVQ